MRIYSLSCGHSDSGTLSPGMMTMCPTCLCYARIIQVSSESPTPNSDAIVNMVFDAIGTWNTRAPCATSPPFDLTVEVKARFREALNSAPVASAGTSIRPANPINNSEVASRCLRALVEYFNTQEGYKEFGHGGDMDGLPPEQTAIRGLKSCSRGRKAYNNLLRDLETAQRDVAALQERYDRDMETTRNERNQAQARVGSFVLDVKDRNDRIQKLEDGLRSVRETLRTPPLGFGIDMNSLSSIIGRILQ